ncbi:MAG: hypothetical protein KDB03_03090 [Planctomycetales bacterium]|nr:hypothetical protein [Planctomycetales bacterium]
MIMFAEFVTRGAEEEYADLTLGDLREGTIAQLLSASTSKDHALEAVIAVRLVRRAVSVLAV